MGMTVIRSCPSPSKCFRNASRSGGDTDSRMFSPPPVQVGRVSGYLPGLREGRRRLGVHFKGEGKVDRLGLDMSRWTGPSEILDCRYQVRSNLRTDANACTVCAISRLLCFNLTQPSLSIIVIIIIIIISHCPTAVSVSSSCAPVIIDYMSVRRRTGWRPLAWLPVCLRALVAAPT